MQVTKQKELPLIFSKKYLSTQYFNRSFEWVRRHVLTNEELAREKIPLEQFNRYKDFPPEVAKKIRTIIFRKLF